MSTCNRSVKMQRSIDERLEERERDRAEHVLARFLKKLCPVLAYNGPPRTRRSVESQLLQRSDFLPGVWSEYGPPAEVIAILEIVQKELSLPNHNFIPDDPLVLLMSSGYDKDDVYVLLGLEERYGVKYQDEEVERIRNEDWTLGRFVKDLFERNRKRDITDIGGAGGK